jgi:hypothetical protein
MDKMGRGDILLQIHTYKYSTRFSFGRLCFTGKSGGCSIAFLRG